MYEYVDIRVEFNCVYLFICLFRFALQEPHIETTSLWTAVCCQFGISSRSRVGTWFSWSLQGRYPLFSFPSIFIFSNYKKITGGVNEEFLGINICYNNSQPFNIKYEPQWYNFYTTVM